MGKSRKSKRVFKKPLTKAELEGAAAYGLSREMPPHQRLEFAKAMNSDVKEGDLSYTQSLAKKAQGFLTPEEKKRSNEVAEKAMDLAEKAKLRYGRERITAAEAVTFIKDEWMRDFVRTTLLNMLIDKVIEIAAGHDGFTNEQYKEIRSHFRGMVELNIFNHEEDGKFQIYTTGSSEEEIDSLYELAVEYTDQYNKGITAEEATKTIDSWKRLPAKHLLLSRAICVLFMLMIGESKFVTQEQYEEVSDYIRDLTSRYITYTMSHQIEVVG